MKTKLKVLAGIVIVAAWFFFDARSDYMWSDIMTKKKTTEGWTLAATQDNFADLLRPWTWFKSPVTGLWFTKPQDMRQNGSIVVAPVLRVSYDYSKTEQEEYVEFFNLATGKSAFLPDKTPLEMVNMATLEWHEYPVGTPGDLLIQYMQKTRTIR
jgi:hypothetical protein